MNKPQFPNVGRPIYYLAIEKSAAGYDVILKKDTGRSAVVLSGAGSYAEAKKFAARRFPGYNVVNG